MLKEFSQKYRDLLFNDFKSLNLTRISDPQEFYEKQIIDSLYPLRCFPEFKEELKFKKLHIDIGFGGGFPLLPLAKTLEESEFLSIGLEARRKKAKAVEEIAKKLGLLNTSTFHYRVEEILFDKDATLTFKAVGKIKDLLKKISFKEKVEIGVYFYKGPKVLELEEVPEKVGSFKKVLFSPYNLPSGHLRHFIGYRSENVPRGTKKNLVKLSELL